MKRIKKDIILFQMMKKYHIKIILFILLLFFVLLLFSSCLTSSKNNIQVIENYYDENNFAYIIENSKMTPIKYNLTETLIQPFDISFFDRFINSLNFDFDKEKPLFLNNNDISFYEKCNPYLDIRFYFEAKQYFAYLLKEEIFQKIFNYLNKYANENPPSPYKIELGDFINMYQNGIEYNYPFEKGATIIEFTDKSYQIKFKDKRIFYLLQDGSYFETFEDGSEIYYVDNQRKYFRRWFGSILLVKTDKYIQIQLGKNNITFYLDSDNLIKYCQSDKFELYLYPDNNQITSVKDDKINLQYFIDSNFELDTFKKIIYRSISNIYIINDNINGKISFKFDNYIINIQSNFIKTIYKFNDNDNSTILLSIFLPEGIKFYDFDSQSPKTELNLVYNFKKISINHFTFYYPEGIELSFNRFNVRKLEELINILSNFFNITKLTKQIDVIIPIDIYQYQSLLCGQIKRNFSGLPDGYMRDGIIIMWPFNLPRYYEDKDMNYFFENEIYDILLFQLVKMYVNQQSSFFSRIPYFLEVGLPLYITSLYDEKIKNSLENIYNNFLKKNLNFDKNLLILATPENCAMPYAKYLATFSWHLIKYICHIYGSDKINSFITNFKIDFGLKNFSQLYSNEDFLNFSNKNIIEIFGVSFEKLIEAAIIFYGSF
ncbi:MAG: hypothetical protein ACK4YF_03355 [Exilispira sp.]